jgi:hypothetical protein
MPVYSFVRPMLRGTAWLVLLFSSACSFTLREELTLKSNGNGTAKFEYVIRTQKGGLSNLMSGMLSSEAQKQESPDLTSDPTVGDSDAEPAPVFVEDKMATTIEPAPVDTNPITFGDSGVETQAQDPDTQAPKSKGNGLGDLMGAGQGMAANKPDPGKIMARLQQIPGISGVKSNFKQMQKRAEAARKKKKGNDMMAQLEKGDSFYFQFKFANVLAFNKALAAVVNSPDTLNALSYDAATGRLVHRLFPFQLDPKQGKDSAEKANPFSNLQDMASSPFLSAMFGPAPVYELVFNLPVAAVAVSEASAQLGKKGKQLRLQMSWAELLKTKTLRNLEIRLK